MQFEVKKMVSKYLNRATLYGAIDSTVETRTTQDGKEVVNFKVKTADQYKDNEYPTWHNVVVWASHLVEGAKFLGKNDWVYIEGANRTRKYQDKMGNDRYIHEIVLQGLESKLIVPSAPVVNAASNSEDGNSVSDNEAINDEIPF